MKIKKILIIGKGVIGSIYGYALMKNNYQVFHFLRNNNFNLRYWLDIYDERFKKSIKESYVLTRAQHLKDDLFDLVIVPVKHYQVYEVGKIISLNFKKTPVLFFGNILMEIETLIKLFNQKNLIFFGMPRAGGSIKNDNLRGTLLKEVILGEVNRNQGFYQEIKLLFQSITLKVKEVDKIEDWYWTHLATTLVWICGAVKKRGFLNYSRSIKSIYESLNLWKELKLILEKYKINPDYCSDAEMFKIPKPLLSVILYFFFKLEKILRISQGHGEYAKEEMFKIYEDFLNLAQKLKINTPILQSYKKYFIEMMSYN